MRFSLHYRGALKANGSPTDKHALRLALHPQLKRVAESRKIADRYLSAKRDSRPGKAREAATSSIAGWRFVSLMVQLEQHQFDVVSHDVRHWIQAFSEEEPTVDLNITMFRPGAPGQIMDSGGDIDNRLKTLFDALQPPNSGLTKLCERTGTDPDPVICLLADDAQIASLRVDTRTLYDYSDPTEVLLVIDIDANASSLLR